MTGRARVARQSRRKGRLEGERKRVSGLKSRRGHAVCPLSSLRRVRRQPTGTRKEGSNGFRVAVGPCRLSSPQRQRPDEARRGGEKIDAVVPDGIGDLRYAVV